MADVSGPSTTLSGQRIHLRPFRIGDAADVAESCRDADIPRFTFMPESMTEQQATEWIERRLELRSRGLFAFAITVPPEDRCIGQIGVFIDDQSRRAETFYWLDRRHRGLGIATEALDVVTRWAFEQCGAVRAQLITHLDNDASQAVARRAGYQKEGVLRAWEEIKDQRPDVIMWSRLASDPAPNLDRR